MSGDETEQGEKPAKVPRSALSSAKRNHTRACNTLIKNLTAPTFVKPENAMYLDQSYQQTTILLRTLNDIHDQFLVSEGLDDDSGELDDNYTLQDTVEQNYWLVYHKVKPQTPSKSSKHDHTPSPRLKIPDLPAFDNTVRGYLKFKNAFRGHYEKFYGEHAAIVLKNNLLTGSSKDLCSGCNAVDEIFQNLDLVYGDSGKLVDTVMAEIERLPRCSEGNINDIKKIRNAIQCAILDLKTANLAHLISQYQTVILVVRKLSPSVQRRWAEKLVADNTSTDKRFDALVQFLDIEIRTLELIADTSRSSANPGFQDTLDPKPDQRPPKVKRTDSKPLQTPDPPAPKEVQEKDKKRGEKKCPVHPNTTHFFSYCRAFRSMSHTEQVKILSNEAKDYCRSCLRNTHTSSTCDVSLKPCQKCSRHHFTFLHDACNELAKTDKRPHSYRSDASFSSCSISPVQRVRLANPGNGTVGFINALWDSGSNLSLISSRTCQEYQLETLDEDPSSLNIETVGGQTLQKQSRRYKVPLFNHESQLVCTIIAYEIESIGDIDLVDLTSAYEIFNISAEERNQMIYPFGDIQVLIGADNAQLVLRHVSEVEGLRLSESQLGKVIWGKHSSFAEAQTRPRRAVIAKLAATTTCSSRSSKADAILDREVRSLFATESMGVQNSSTPPCGQCSCGNCHLDSSKLSLQEKFEHQQIKSSIQIEDGTITASYPYRRSLATLPDNYELAFRRLEQIERKLQKSPELGKQYQAQFDDMLAKGNLRRLTPEERSSWDGAIQYLPHNYVLKPGSSTPCRLIFDPSSKYKGHAVNDYWGRGPNLVNDQFGVSLRFREYPVAFYGDIRKMYHTVKTTPVEWHLHRVLWRDLDTSRPPDVYIITCNSFGSGPAGTVAIVALFHLAELSQEKFPRAASTILNQSYVDDLLDSTDDLSSAQQITKEIDEILSIGGFQIKKWTIVNLPTSPTSDASVSEDTNRDLPITSSDSVLGLAYDTAKDEFYFIVHLNFTKKRRGLRLGPDLTKDQVLDITVVPTLTKRLILSQVHAIYDPIGFLAPFIVELKFALGKLWRYQSDDGKQLQWDDPVPPEYDAHWRQLFNNFFDIERIRVPRCINSPMSSGMPLLIAFSDSSMISFGACVYVRWQLTDGNHLSRLVAAKSRMWPIDPDDYITVCRGELQAAVLAKRLASAINKESRLEFSEIVYCTDSEIVYAQINMDSHSLSTFVGPRVAEILVATEPGQWWICSGKDNPCADLVSRGTTDTTQLDRNSTWQNGPDWLKSPRESWPLSHTRKTRTPIPELRIEGLKHRTLATNISVPSSNHKAHFTAPTCQVMRVIDTIGEKSSDVTNFINGQPDIRDVTDKHREFIASIIDLTRNDNLEIWFAVTYRVMYALSWKKGDKSVLLRLAEHPVISAAQREVAKLFWLRDAQRTLEPKIRSGQYKTLTPFRDSDGIYRCNARSGKISGYQPILLPHSHPISRLIVKHFHRRGHGGATSTAAKTRSEYHILQLRSLARSVRNECQLCKLVEKKLMSAPMGSLPISRITKSFPFENCSCDICGPFHVYYPVKQTRARRPSDIKAYALVITCLSTRAIHIELMIGEDTGAFLQAFRRFASIRGQPRHMYSDCGGQIVSADETLKAIVNSLDNDTLQQYGATDGISWHYSAPGSPWQNGVSEALIRSVKFTLSTMTSPNQQLQVLELQTVFYEIASILNERPISLGHHGASGSDFDSEANTYLCPNQLLLGRSTVRIPSGPFQSVPMSHSDRLLAVQTIVTDWWNRWTSQYLPTLMYQSKWYHDGRHARVGDIVYVKDLNPIRGNWHIAEIIQVRPTPNGTPINVLVRYKTPATDRRDYTPTPFKTQWRDIKNLSLIVASEQRSELDASASEFKPKDAQ